MFWVPQWRVRYLALWRLEINLHTQTSICVLSSERWLSTIFDRIRNTCHVCYHILTAIDCNERYCVVHQFSQITTQIDWLNFGSISDHVGIYRYRRRRFINFWSSTHTHRVCVCVCVQQTNNNEFTSSKLMWCETIIKTATHQRWETVSKKLNTNKKHLMVCANRERKTLFCCLF